MHSIIDNKYFFPVRRNILTEIRNRSNRNNGTPSLIGYGAVPATIYKKSMSDINSVYDLCMSQLVPLKNTEKQEKTMQFGSDWFDDDFFGKKLTSDEKLNNIVQGIKKRKSLVTRTEKDIKKKRSITVKTKAHPAVAQYYEEIKKNHQFGSIGLLPKVYASDSAEFPHTIEIFIATSEGDMLQNFCKRYVK